MKKFNEELKLAISEATARADRAFPIPRDLVFDDEPIEAVLYEKASVSATPASIFSSARRSIQRIQEAAQRAEGNEAMAIAIELFQAGCPVSQEIFRQLAGILKGLKLGGQSLYAAYPTPPRADCPPEARILAGMLGQKITPDDAADLRLAAEELQYGAGLIPPTAAIIADWTLRLIPRLQDLAAGGNLDETLRTAARFIEAPHPVPGEVLANLLRLLQGLREHERPLIPTYPQLPRSHCQPEVRLLLEWIWQEAGKRGDEDLRLAVGTPLYRWSEIEQRYDYARQVLQTMIEIYHRRHAALDEAICRANYAFEFFYERNWGEAIAHFEQVIALFKSIGNELEVANAQANYWLCRVENEGLCEIDAMEAQMKKAAAIFKGDWRARKALFLLARIEEARGNLSAALSLAQQCLKIDQQNNTIFLDQDRLYVGRLQMIEARNFR